MPISHFDHLSPNKFIHSRAPRTLLEVDLNAKNDRKFTTEVEQTDIKFN